LSSTVNTNLSATDWEALWSPYDQPTYSAILDLIHATDVVVEIGAGDLRLARQIIQRAMKVYAVEINPMVLKLGSKPPISNFQGLIPICADARQFDIPSDTSVGVLLMRHCLNFRLYAQKLKQAGVHRLITNARWRMGVECVRLQIERVAYSVLSIGWFACWCGAVGFKPGAVEALTPENVNAVYEVINCPVCTV
jgi:hypothetical protein